MNATSLTLHLLIKDLRHQRWWLALLWAFALALPFMLPSRLIAGHPELGLDRRGALVVGALFVLILTAFAQAVRLDAPGRRVHFLATRPVPYPALLAEKFLFAAVLLMVPLWLARLEVIWLMKIPVDALDVALLLLETTLFTGGLLAGVMLVSLFVRSLPAILASMGIGFMLVMAADSLVESHWQLASRLWPFYTPLSRCCFLLFYIIIMATAGAAAIALYRRRPRRAAPVVVAAGILLAAAGWWFWPYDFSRLVPGDSRSFGPVPADLAMGIKLTLTGKEGEMNNRVQGLAIENGEHYSILSHDLSMAGVEPPWFYRMVDYHAVATLKSGATIHSSYEDVHAHGMVGGMGDAYLAKVAGVQSTDEIKWDVGALEIFNFFPGRYKQEDLADAHIEGVITLEIRKVVLLKIAPLKVGAFAYLPRRRFVLQNVNVTPGGVNCLILMTGVDCALRGDQRGVEGPFEFSALVFNRARSEYLRPTSSGANSGSAYFYQSGIMEATLETIVDANNNWSDYNNKPFPAHWADDAEIAFFTTEPCGLIDVPYELKSVNLRQ